VENVLSLLGQDPLTGEGDALTRCAVASARTMAAHASALLQQTIITPYPRARRSELMLSPYFDRARSGPWSKMGLEGSRDKACGLGPVWEMEAIRPCKLGISS
jgi:hypothetical protein